MTLENIIKKYLNEMDIDSISFKTKLGKANYYMSYALEAYQDTKINNWVLEVDIMSKTSVWYHPAFDKWSIFATPFWDDKNGIVLYNVDNKTKKRITPIEVIPFSLTWKEKKDVMTYFNIMKKKIPLKPE